MKWNKMLIVASILFFFLSCSSDYTPPRFKVGDMVETVINNNKGMVIRVYEGGLFDDKYLYTIRFPITQMYTNTHILGEDGPITIHNFETVYMYEFELKESR